MEKIKSMQMENETVPKTDIIFAGRLSSIGVDEPGRVKSEITSDIEVNNWIEVLKQHIVPVTIENTASCGDGRPFVSTAADYNSASSESNTKDSPVQMYQLFGGLSSALSHAAVLADWSGFEHEPTNFTDAKKQITDYVESIGLEDCAHTSTEKFDDPSSTDCGFEMGFASALKNTLTGDLNPVMATMAALNGLSSPDAFSSEDKVLIHEILDEGDRLISEAGFYESYDPIANRDELKKKYNGKNLIVLKAEHDETHGHHEGMLVVVKPMGVTVDQKSMADADKQVFVYHQGKAEDVAKTAGGSTREQRKLKLALDFSSIVIAHGKLFASDMPALVVA